MDIVDLREFYASRLGAATRRTLSAHLREAVPRHSGYTAVGLGYATPYLADCVPESEARLAFMPAKQGVFRWPEGGAVQSALVDECDLPLLESVADVVMVVHGLEHTESPEDMLKEVWRVLAPQGRLLLVVPNRRGVWARFDNSPFGYGQPYSRPQLARLLKDAQFSVTSWAGALYFPPSAKGLVLSSASAIERGGSRFMPLIAGAIVVEAVKQVYAVASGKRVRRLVSVTRPALTPVPSRRDAVPSEI